MVQILDQLDGIVRIELAHDLGHGFGRKGLHHVLANIVVQLGHNVAAHQVGDGSGKIVALAPFQQFKQVGDVSGVQRLYQIVDAVFDLVIQGFANLPHELRFQPVFLVELLPFALLGFLRGGRFDVWFVKIGLGHRQPVYCAVRQKQDGPLHRAGVWGRDFGDMIL